MGRKAIIFGILFLVILGILIYLVLKGSAWFVSSFDGNNNPSMEHLVENVFYFHKDSNLWMLEANTGAYKNIIKYNLDSLNWDSNIVIGYTNFKYFIIDLRSGQKVTYYDVRDSIFNLIETKLPINGVSGVPTIQE